MGEQRGTNTPVELHELDIYFNSLGWICLPMSGLSTCGVSMFFGWVFLYKLKSTALLILGRNEYQISFTDRVWGDEMYHLAKFHQNPSIRCTVIVIFQFFKMAAAAILDFRKSQILLAEGVQRAEMHHYAKFCQNPSILCTVIVIFSFCKKVATTMLDLRNSQTLLAFGVCKAEMHHCAKFHQNLSILCRDIAIFRYLKMVSVHHLGFVWGIFGQSTKGTWLFLSLCKI